MAGDWIKFELATQDKPEVVAMAEVLGTTTYDVVGRLLRVWGWFDQQTENGNAVSVTGDALMRYIDRISESQGFAACMRNVGWLSADGLPNFDRHNGETSKKRVLTAKRVKRFRNAESVTKALPEKRREDKPPIAPRGFLAFWESYPARRRIAKSKCLEIWVSKHLEAAAEQVALHVEAMKLTPDWLKEDGKYIPASATYLNQRRFEDGVPDSPRPRLVI